MDIINITSEELRKLKPLLSKEKEGFEGRLYLYNDQNHIVVLKIFKKLGPETLDNKMEKIRILNKLQLENTTVPEKLVFIDGKFQGYSMRHYENTETFFDLSLKTGKKRKIAMLKKAKNVILRLHQNGINIIDFNPNNFMIVDQNIVLCDSDNWKVSSLKPDILDVTTKFLLSVGFQLNNILDVYNFNLMTISVLKRIYYPYVLSYLRINSLRINKNANKIARDLLKFSTSENSQFIVDYCKTKRLS